MSRQWKQKTKALVVCTDSPPPPPRFTRACGNTAFTAGSHSFVLTGVSIELTKDGKQAIVSCGFTRADPLQSETTHREQQEKLRVWTAFKSTLSGGTGSILPAGQGVPQVDPTTNNFTCFSKAVRAGRSQILSGQ